MTTPNPRDQVFALAIAISIGLLCVDVSGCGVTSDARVVRRGSLGASSLAVARPARLGAAAPPTIEAPCLTRAGPTLPIGSYAIFLLPIDRAAVTPDVHVCGPICDTPGGCCEERAARGVRVGAGFVIVPCSWESAGRGAKVRLSQR